MAREAPRPPAPTGPIPRLVWIDRAVAHSSTVQLAVAGSLLGAILLGAFVLPMPLWDGRPSSPPSVAQAAAAPIAGRVAGLVAVGFMASLCLPYWPYRLALRAATQYPVAVKPLLGMTAILAMVAFFMYPGYGSDVLVYIAYARLWVVYGDNPLLATPAQHPEDWTFAYVWIVDRSIPYGPLWALVSGGLAHAAGDSLALAVLAFKSLAAACYGLCCALIWWSVAPPRRERALVLFGWSPLVLFDVLGKGHNDILPAVAAVAAVGLVTRSSGILGVGTAAAGSLAKIYGLAMAPALAKHLWKRHAWLQLGVGVILSLVLTGLLYAPFWAGPRTLEGVWQQTSRQVWGPGVLLDLALAGVTAGDPTLLRRVILVGACLGICIVVFRRGRVETTADVAHMSAHLLLATLLLLTTAFYAHYLVPVVALAAVADCPRLDRCVAALSVGSLAAYGVEILAAAFGSGWLGSTPYQVLGSMLTLGPVLGVVLHDRLFGRRGGSYAGTGRAD